MGPHTPSHPLFPAPTAPVRSPTPQPDLRRPVFLDRPRLHFLTVILQPVAQFDGGCAAVIAERERVGVALLLCIESVVESDREPEEGLEIHVHGGLRETIEAGLIVEGTVECCCRADEQ